MQFPVALEYVPVRVRFKKPLPRCETVEWPVVKMTAWISTLVKECSQYLLGGFPLEHADGWKMLFAGFWSQYRHINPNHAIYSTAMDRCCVVPYALHGDEGKGLRGKPYFVESWQLSIGVGGPFKTNESGLPS